MATALKIKRVSMDIKQWELARKVDIPQVTLSMYESGKRNTPYDMQMLLAKALNCERKEIFPEECNKEVNEFNKSCSRF